MSRSEIPTSTPPQKLLLLALDSLSRMLARRDHSEKELRQKLKDRYPDAIIDQAIAEAHQRRWIHPPEVLAEIVERQLHRRGKSQTYINSYLARKGLPSRPLQRNMEVMKVRKLIESKWTREELSNFELKAKAFRWLRGRGFDSRAIQQALNFTAGDDDLGHQAEDFE